MDEITPQEGKTNFENNNIEAENKKNLRPPYHHTFSYLSNSSDNSSLANPPIECPGFTLSSKSRMIVYSFFLISNVLISMDHGSIPASTLQLRQLTTHDQSIGLFGSLVYVGNIIGSLFLFAFINMYNRKHLLIISLLVNAIFLYAFVLTTHLPSLFLNRIIVGIFQAYVTIYLPVWCNQYGEASKRTVMIAFVQFGSPVGIFFGYLIASISIQENLYGGWTFAFVVQAALILLLTIVFLFVPQKYFDKDIYSLTDSLGNERFVMNANVNKAQKNANLPFMTMLSIIAKKKIFVYSVGGLAILIYVISGVQYWISDYMMNILQIISSKKRLFYFTLVCFTSPTLGVLVGTFTKNAFCKNDITKSLIFCLILGVFACLFAIIVPLLSNILAFLIAMWFVLFFGGGIVPVITNIIITAVPKKLDASGNSITNLISNLFGYLPAPYIYGILSDIFGDKGIIGMRFTMWYSVIGVLFFALATYSSVINDKKHLKKQEEREELKIN